MNKPKSQLAWTFSTAKNASFFIVLTLAVLYTAYNFFTYLTANDTIVNNGWGSKGENIFISAALLAFVLAAWLTNWFKDHKGYKEYLNNLNIKNSNDTPRY